MSDDDRDIDIESDEDDSDSKSQPRQSGSQYFSQVNLAEKRAHHNALERKRRDHIKDSFSSLRESVPALQNEKVASRAQILKKAAEYIQFMRRKNSSHQQDIDDLKRQNNLLETQIKTLERARSTGNFAIDSENNKNDENGYGHESGSDTSDTESAALRTNPRRGPKKLKVSGYGH